jgi:hypothetical protein
MTVHTTPPPAFEAGTTVTFTQAPITTALGVVSPADGWALEWLLRKTDGSDDADITATDDGTTWTVALSPTASAALSAGSYRWALRASQGTPVTAVTTLSSGTVTVTPDLSAAGEDVRTWEERTLAIVEAALAGTLEGETRMYMIAGRQVQTFAPAELMRLRAQLQTTIAAQRGTGFGVAVRAPRGFIR